MRMRAWATPARIALACGLLAGLWVYLIDSLYGTLGPNPLALASTELRAHLAISALTAAAVYVLVRRELFARRAIEILENRARERTAELEAAHEALLDEAAERSKAHDSNERLMLEIDEQRRRFQTVFRHATIGIAVFDGGDLRLKWANPAYQSFLDEGFRTVDLVGRTLLEIVPGAEQAGIFDIFRRVAQTGQAYNAPEFAHTGLARGVTYWSWSLVPLSEDGNEQRELMLMAMEITEQVEARIRVEELAAMADGQASELAGIFAAIADAVLVWDESFLVVHANRMAINLLGVDAVGLHPGAVVDRLRLCLPEGLSAQPDQLPLTGALQSQTATEERLTCTDAEGRDRVLLITTTPLEVRGANAGAVMVLRDVTAFEHLLGQVQKYAGELEEANLSLGALLDISRSVTAILDLKPLLGFILEQLKTVVDYSGAAIMVPDGESVVFLEYRGLLPAESVRGFRAPLEAAPLYYEVARAQAPLAISDLEGDAPLAQRFRLAVCDQVRMTLGTSRSVLGLPLMAKEGMIGMLRLDARSPDAFTPRHMKLAMALASQAAVAIENARLYESAQRAAALEERQRLARELHDSVSQSLYGIVLGSHAAIKMIQSSPESLESALHFVLAQAEAATTEMRALILELHPETLAIEGLSRVLAKQAAAVQARHGFVVNSRLEGEPDLPLGSKEGLYRVAQEALFNAARHAKASQVNLSLECSPEWATLEVSDDGIGFDPEDVPSGHIGLGSMRERVRRIGGQLEIESAPGQGTVIRARVPLDGH